MLFVLLMFGWTKNWYFTSDIEISAKTVGGTHHIKLSDPISLAFCTYSQWCNYDKQSVKPSSYR